MELEEKGVDGLRKAMEAEGLDPDDMQVYSVLQAPDPT